MPDPENLTEYPVGTSALAPMSRNATDLDKLINGTGIVENRAGGILTTWQKLEADFDSDADNAIAEFESDAANALANYAAFNNTGAWSTGTVYDVNDLWSDAESWYLVIESYTSGATVADDIAGGAVALYQTLESVWDIPTVTQLRLTEPLYNGQQVELLGHTEPGSGGGIFYYDEVDATSEDDNGATIVTSGGARWKRKKGSTITLEQFGAVANDSSFDCAPAFEAARDHLYSVGGGYIEGVSGSTYYFLKNSSLSYDPRKIGANWNGATLDFSLRSYTDPATATEELSNPSFDTDSVWADLSSNTSGEAWTISGGDADFTPTVDDTYAGLAQQITLTPGKKYRITVNITRIEQGVNLNYFIAAVRPNGDDAGSPNYSLSANSVGEHSATFSYPLSESPTPWFQIKHQGGGCTVSEVSVKEEPDNTCLLCDGFDDSSESYQYGHRVYSWSGFNIYGGSNDARDYGIAIETITTVPTMSSRPTFRDFEIRNFYKGFELRDRSYLTIFDSGTVVGCSYGVHFIGGPDSGENIKLSNMTFGACSVACIQNDGCYMHVDKCSLDYSTKFAIQNGGYTHFNMCHFETSRDFNGDVSRILNSSGEMIFDKGYMQINATGTQNTTPVFETTNQKAKITIDKMQGFGINSTDSILHSGPGWIQSELTGIGQKSCASFLDMNERFSLVPESSSNNGTDLDWDVFVGNIGTVIDRQNTDGLEIAVATTPQRTTGNNIIEVRKVNGFGTGDPASFTISAQINRKGMIGVKLYYQLIDGAQGSNTIWVTRKDARVIENGGVLPSVSQSTFWGEATLTEGSGWKELNFSQSFFDEASTDKTERGLESRTHALIDFNVIGMGDDAVLYIADIHVDIK